jgi:hypothetical protein
MVQRKWITNNPIFKTTNIFLSCNTPCTPARAYMPSPQVKTSQPSTDTGCTRSVRGLPGLHIARTTPTTVACSTAQGPIGSKSGEKGYSAALLHKEHGFRRHLVIGTSLWSETIPKTGKPRRYLIRHIITSLHSANKLQFYPEYVHLDVNGRWERVFGEDTWRVEYGS